MAGRPRLYADAAAKARAYRQREEERTVKWDRLTAEDLQAHLKRLHLAVLDAQAAGDALARSLDTITLFDLLAGLTAHFEQRATLDAADPIAGSGPVPVGRESSRRR
jgi:hypothetical protein